MSRKAVNLMVAALVALAALAMPAPADADEPCQSPYIQRLTGEEEFVYVWTLGVEGMGDGSDKLVTVDVRKGSRTFGQVIHAVSVGGRHEAHHGGFTDDRRYFWASGLDTSKIFVFDVHSDPAKPRLTQTIDDFVTASGGIVGPHTIYALPGRMLIAGLSNARDHGGPTGLVEYTNDGKYITTHWMPIAGQTQGAVVEKVADGFGYDVRVLPSRNVMLTSSFTGWSNYMMDFGQMLKDPEAMKRFGQTMVVWDFHARQPRKVLHVPGAPLEIRFANQPGNNYAFTTTALTSKIWLIHEDANGEWQAKAVADVGDPAKVPLPVAITLSSDDRTLWVDSFMDGTVRAYDVTNPHAPKLAYEKRIGSQLNMVSQSWDGKRLYFTSSVLARWDKKGAEDEQYLKAYTWDGKALEPRFALDFKTLNLGRPHLMRFGSTALHQK